jgi:hypothetical protein
MITHETAQHPTHLSVKTIIVHVSGGSRSIEINIPLAEYTTRDGKVKKVDAHMIGSAITYGRRYGLSAILGIPADEDDDGNLAAIPADDRGNNTQRQHKGQAQSSQPRPQNGAQSNSKQQSLPKPKYSSGEIKNLYLNGVHPDKKEICVNLTGKYGKELINWPPAVLEAFLEEIKLTEVDAKLQKEILQELSRDDDALPPNQRMMINRIQAALKVNSIEYTESRLNDYLAFLSTKFEGSEINISSVFKEFRNSWSEFLQAEEPAFSTVEALAKWALDSHWIRLPHKIRNQITKDTLAIFKTPLPDVAHFVSSLVEIRLGILSWEELCKTIALSMGYPVKEHLTGSLSFHLEKLSEGKSLASIRVHMAEAQKICAEEVKQAAQVVTTSEKE